MPKLKLEGRQATSDELRAAGFDLTLPIKAAHQQWSSAPGRCWYVYQQDDPPTQENP